MSEDYDPSPFSSSTPPCRTPCLSTHTTKSPAVSPWSLCFILLGPNSVKTVVLNLGKSCSPTKDIRCLELF